MDIYIGTSSADREFLEQLAQHIEAQGVHPARIEESWGVGMSQLTVECADYDVAEIAKHFYSFKPELA